MKKLPVSILALAASLALGGAVFTRQMHALEISNVNVIPPGTVTDEPYSADTQTEQLKTLSDGTRLHLKGITLKSYRDDAGRTRAEHFPLRTYGVEGGNEEPTSIVIRDPLAGTVYELNPRLHVAQLLSPVRQDLTDAVPSLIPTPEPAANMARPEIKTEDLGTQMIEGLLVYGTRITRTVPPGAQGNDQPLVTTTDRWVSRELSILVLMKSQSPTEGDETVRLVNISRDDPSPSLFQVPADYTIKRAR